MIEWIKQIFCKHTFAIIEDYTWITSINWNRSYRELRKFLVCKKCGKVNKISKR